MDESNPILDYVRLEISRKIGRFQVATGETDQFKKNSILKSVQFFNFNAKFQIIWKYS